eukprot:CAMPEP_0183290680 /NCGR_PEP_ID=MMETSP0160_2-20130417/310_1 /TAXON_ID=2839 ORGANISM="Odontella Sinensis, Strain Grunow 1884" /NCGR_SAMPLE_ID=MMETSP0160_2 /ASSEMBLY_ACC=CAM_ASM_000250 /LENGTH=72 /DNA_ID=CAMNT_0025451333 /DNA_START=52 /DNA_END=270 /DNA_ORIENTATION=+
MATVNAIRFLTHVPVPLFGNAGLAASLTMQKAKALPRFAPWILPGTVGGLWFVWPAVDEEWKVEVGISKAPQ